MLVWRMDVVQYTQSVYCGPTTDCGRVWFYERTSNGEPRFWACVSTDVYVIIMCTVEHLRVRIYKLVVNTRRFATRIIINEVRIYRQIPTKGPL